MADGEVRTDLTVNTDNWTPQLQSAGAEVQTLGQTIESALQRGDVALVQLGGSSQRNLGKVGSEAKAAEAQLTSLKNASTAFSVGALAIGGAVIGLGASLLSAGHEAHHLEVSLRGVFGEQAESVTEAIRKMGDALGVFTNQELAESAKALQKWGQYSEANLKLVADLAAKTGSSVQTMASKWAQFEAADSATAARAFRGLQRELGVTNAKLEEFGGVINKVTHKPLLENEAQINANRAALEKWAAVNATGSMEKMSTEAGKLAGAWKMLKEDVGLAAVEIEEHLAPSLRKAVDLLREGANWLGILDAGLHKTAEGAKEFGKLKELLHAKTPQQALAAGFTSESAGKLIENMKAQLAEVAKAGDDVQARDISTRIRKLTALQAAMKAAEPKPETPDDLSKAEHKKADAEALKERKQKVQDEIDLVKQQSAAHLITKKEELEKLQAILNSGQVSEQAMHDKRTALMNAIAQLQGQLLDKQTAADKKAAAEAKKAESDKFNAAIGSIKARATAREIDKAQELSELRQLVTAFKLTGQEKIRVAQEIAAAQAGIRREAEQKERKDAADKRKQEREEAKRVRLENREGKEIGAAQKQGIEAQKQDVESAERDAQQRRREAKTTADLQKAGADAQKAIKSKIDLQLKEINMERDLANASTDSAKVKAANNEAAEQKIKAARNESTRALREDTAEQKKAVDELLKAKDKLAGKKAASTEFTGGIMSLADFAKESSDRFGTGATAARDKVIADARAAAAPVSAPALATGPTSEEMARKNLASQGKSQSEIDKIIAHNFGASSGGTAVAAGPAPGVKGNPQTDSQVLATILTTLQTLKPTIVNEIVMPSGQRQTVPVAANKAPNVHWSAIPPGGA